MDNELNKWFYRINNSQEYEVEKLDPRTKRWVKIGKVSGDKRPLTFDVTGLEEGQEYDFRVTAINAEGESEALTTDCAIKAKNPFGRRIMHACMVHAEIENWQHCWKLPQCCQISKSIARSNYAKSLLLLLHGKMLP